MYINNKSLLVYNKMSISKKQIDISKEDYIKLDKMFKPKHDEYMKDYILDNKIYVFTLDQQIERYSKALSFWDLEIQQIQNNVLCWEEKDIKIHLFLNIMIFNLIDRIRIVFNNDEEILKLISSKYFF